MVWNRTRKFIVVKDTDSFHMQLPYDGWHGDLNFIHYYTSRSPNGFGTGQGCRGSTPQRRACSEVADR